MANNVGFRHDESGRARADWSAASVYHVDVKQSTRRGQIAAIGFGRRSMGYIIDPSQVLHYRLRHSNEG
jgi:hypothetical protein